MITALVHDQADMEKGVKAYVNQHNLNVKVIRVGKFEEDELDSSSKIRQKIVEKFSR